MSTADSWQIWEAFESGKGERKEFPSHDGNAFMDHPVSWLVQLKHPKLHKLYASGRELMVEIVLALEYVWMGAISCRKQDFFLMC